MRGLLRPTWIVLLLPLCTLASGCGEHDKGVNPLPQPAGRIWRVPAEAPSIQAGIDSASAGDTVLVAAGTYYERGILMKSGVCLRGNTGDSLGVAVDGQQQGRVFYCEDLDSTTCIQRIAITGGTVGDDEFSDRGGGMYCTHCSLRLRDCAFYDNSSPNAGGAFYCSESAPVLERCTFTDNGNYAAYFRASSGALTECAFAVNEYGGLKLGSAASPTITACRFVGNGGSGIQCDSGSAPAITGCTFMNNGDSLWTHGGGIQCIGAYSSPAVTRCVFVGNVAVSGGGVWCDMFTSPTLTSCTFYRNCAPEAAGIYCHDHSSPAVQQSIIAFSRRGEAVYCWCPSSPCNPALTCCDIYGNEGGDWVGVIEDQLGTNGNICEDPLFCDAENAYFFLQPDSPCAANEECGLIGAWGVGCRD